MEIKKGHEKYMKHFFRAMPATLFIKDNEAKYIFTTKVCDLVNAGFEGTIIGKGDPEIQYDKKLGEQYYKEDMEIIDQGISTHTIDEIVTEDGNVYMEIIKNPIINEENEVVGIVGICNDLTELTELKKKYERLCLYDSMTGIYNRNYTAKYDFENEESLPCSYIFCDCNGLKKVNDKYGHTAGDHYIKDTVKILQENAMDQTVLIRWGGDEFLMITPNVTRKQHNEMIERIKKEQRKFTQKDPDTGLAVGDILRTDLNVKKEDIFKIIDQKMYMDKSNSKKENQV